MFESSEYDCFSKTDIHSVPIAWVPFLKNFPPLFKLICKSQKFCMAGC